MGYINRHKVFFAVQKKVYPANFQEKTITPNTFQKEITPDVGYDALSKVKLHGILVDPHSDIESQNDNSVKYQKVIPNNVLTYGGLSKLGGLTYKNGDTLDYAYTKEVDIKGFNIWDEQWEVGSIDPSSGQDIASNSSIVSKNYISVLPNATYYFKIDNGYVRVFFYDVNKNYISYKDDFRGLFEIPTNCYYIRFRTSGYGTTYNNDFCINVSNATLNGTYKPYYNNALLEAKIIAIKQKLIQLGYSADVLGYGLPNVYNYIDLENKQVVLNMGGYTFTGNENWFASSHCYIMQEVLTNVKLPTTPSYYWKANMLSVLPISSWQNLSDGTDTTGIALTFNDGKVVISENDYANISSLTGQTLIYELATPVEIDVSDILDNDDVIGLLESGGTITFENDDKYNLPSDVTYLVEVE